VSVPDGFFIIGVCPAKSDCDGHFECEYGGHSMSGGESGVMRWTGDSSDRDGSGGRISVNWPVSCVIGGASQRSQSHGQNRRTQPDYEDFPAG
jgi:hypothetical protein